MRLTDNELGFFDREVIALPKDKRDEYQEQADTLLARLTNKINEDTTLHVIRVVPGGSFEKRTVLRPRGDNPVDIDVGVYLDLSKASLEDTNYLLEVVRRLVLATYPQMSAEQVQPGRRVVDVKFRVSGLEVDLVPVIPEHRTDDSGYQYARFGEKPILTNVPLHVRVIRARAKVDAQYRILVRTLKWWSRVKNLDALSGFVIELVLAHLLDVHGPAASLEEGLLRFYRLVWQGALKEPVIVAELGVVKQMPNDRVVVLDPANPANNITNGMTDVETQEIIGAALDAWETIHGAGTTEAKGETLELWKDVMGRSFRIED